MMEFRTPLGFIRIYLALGKSLEILKYNLEGVPWRRRVPRSQGCSLSLQLSDCYQCSTSALPTIGEPLEPNSQCGYRKPLLFVDFSKEPPSVLTGKILMYIHNFMKQSQQVARLKCTLISSDA